MTLPTYTGRKYFSAGIGNAYALSLLRSFSWGIAPRAPFSTILAATSGTPLWTGFILYTGDTDTFRYRLNHTASGTSTIKVNGASIATPSGSGIKAGTVDISGLSLTPGTVYSVTLDATAACDPQWLGLSQTINYTTPPTFSNGNALSVANMNTIRTCLLELETAVDMPHTPNILGRQGQPGPNKGILVQSGDDPHYVWRGFFYHAHDTLAYRIRHGTDAKSVQTQIFYDGNDLTGGSDLRLATHDTYSEGTYDLSGLGLTRGNFYECYTTVGIHGTSAATHVFQWVFKMAETSDVDTTAPPVWAHGGTNVSAANMNAYSDTINLIHPGAASPTAPLYYEQPALKLDTSGYRYYIQHRRPYLRYRLRSDVEGKTVEMYYGNGARYALPASEGGVNYSFDLTKVPGLIRGQYYYIDDAEFCCEFSSAQP
jgi:hypothetical protein